MNLLDDFHAFQTQDLSGMYGKIARMADQVRDAVGRYADSGVDPGKYRGISRVVVCGMGGSAIGGDLTAALLADSDAPPIQVCRDYHLPRDVDKNTLIIAVSYSGNTEETLGAAGEALTKGCPLITVTTGGRLGMLAQKHSLPLLCPAGDLPPRAALGYLFVLPMMYLYGAGVSSIGADDFLALAAFLRGRMASLAVDCPASENPAKQLAEKLRHRIVVIYAGPGPAWVAALRFKGQVCENAKMLAFAGQFPEFNHNELVGWELGQTLRDKIAVLILRDSEDSPAINRRIDAVEELIAQKEIDIVEIEAVGKNRLERIFSLIQMADFTSFYLAILNGVDPTPVIPIENLKKRLAEVGDGPGS